MKPSKILIIHTGAIGDFILALPAIGAVRRRFLPASIELLGIPHIGILAEQRFYVDRVASIDAYPLHRLFVGELPAELARYVADFDLIISWFGADDETYRRTLERMPAQTIIARSRPPDGCGIHVVDHLLSTLAPLGISDEDRVPRLFLTERDRQRAERLWNQLGLRGERVIALHPGSGSPEKCWSTSRFVELAWRLIRSGLSVAVIEGPADHHIVERFLSSISSRLDAGSTHRLIRLPLLSLIDLAALLERCSAYVGNDSGITHLAAATGIPTVAIFTVTDPAVWGPRGRVVILRNPPDSRTVMAALRTF
ncbi:MAG: lipopolysaccharide heptosyltransferase family protein [Acidobacteria bacterium]|nr:MAG: lipopolysaccharide heptosyltransferase family protein [Acidobacteriota bacterium]